jgi:hypothetical protein
MPHVPVAAGKNIKNAAVVKRYETFEKCSISFKFKEDEKINHRNIFNISRIKF